MKLIRLSVYPLQVRLPYRKQVAEGQQQHLVGTKKGLWMRQVDRSCRPRPSITSAVSLSE
jgi:hypothetical protein